MSRDLTTLRDWAQRMADGETMRLPDTAFTQSRCTVALDSERVLWRQIANEIDAFLSGDDPAFTDPDQADLFGSESA